MAIEVFIHFNGNCREAVEFYAKVFGNEKPKIMTYGEAPADPEFQLPEEAKKLVLYTFLNICGSNVMFSDMPPGTNFISGNNISISVVSKNIDEIKSFFAQMKEGGIVSMDLQETFWSKCYGMLTDKFGITWQFSYNNT